MLLGFILTILVGLFWAFVGVYFKLLEKWNSDYVKFTLFTDLFSLIIYLVFFTHTKAILSGNVELPGWGYLLFVLIAGVFRYFSGRIHQYSMKYGNSGILWAIGQSYLILPFFAMILLYKEPYSLVNILGNLVLLAGIFILAIKPGEVSREAPRPMLGVALAFLAFLAYGIFSIMVSATSHFSYQDIGQIRSPLLLLGSLLSIFSTQIYCKNWNFTLEKRAWLLMICQSIFSAITLFLQLKALDTLKAVSLSNFFFPIAVGTCIGGYAIISVVLFKEKPPRTYKLGILLIIIGIISYCFVK